MYLPLICILFLLSGCGSPRHQFNTATSFGQVRTTAQQNLVPDAILEPKSYASLLAIEERTFQELSRNEAIRLALKNNPSLQADFQTLGIAQADLVQAGLFTNPDLFSLFRIPKREIDKPNIEIDVPVLNLVDLWQVPLKKQVAQDELEIITKQILEKILTIYADTKVAYDTCLFTQAKYELVLQIVQKAQELYEWVQYRYQFGFETELDIKLTHIMLKNWQSECFAYEAELLNAFTHLTTLLGTQISPEPFKLADDLMHEDPDIPLLYELEDLALQTRPEIHLQQLKVRQARHKIALERSRVIKNMSVGVSYKLDFEGARGTGPVFDMQIPFFDWNQAQIERAKVDLNLQEKLLLATKRSVFEEVQMYYRLYKAGLEQIRLHDVALELYQEALDFAQFYEQRMMYSHTVIINTFKQYFQERIAFMERHFNAHVNFTLLEKAIGKKI